MYYNKVVIVILFIFTLLPTSSLMAQEADFELLSKIIKNGNAKDLVKQFSKNVELNINGKEATYSRAQAEAVLKDFFGKGSPEDFTFNHKGASKGGLPYAIGEYTNSLGNYRVWIRLKMEDGRNLVDEMSFIKD